MISSVKRSVFQGCPYFQKCLQHSRKVIHPSPPQHRVLRDERVPLGSLFALPRQFSAELGDFLRVSLGSAERRIGSAVLSSYSADHLRSWQVLEARGGAGSAHAVINVGFRSAKARVP
jgi:hypothetical protein